VPATERERREGSDDAKSPEPQEKAAGDGDASGERETAQSPQVEEALRILADLVVLDS
jgi:hypothetical protein